MKWKEKEERIDGQVNWRMMHDVHHFPMFWTYLSFHFKLCINYCIYCALTFISPNQQITYQMTDPFSPAEFWFRNWSGRSTWTSPPCWKRPLQTSAGRSHLKCFNSILVDQTSFKPLNMGSLGFKLKVKLMMWIILIY